MRQATQFEGYTALFQMAARPYWRATNGPHQSQI